MSSRGLKYLHEHCYPAVIHRDLKSSNILLDTKFNAKVKQKGHLQFAAFIILFLYHTIS